MIGMAWECNHNAVQQELADTLYKAAALAAMIGMYADGNPADRLFRYMALRLEAALTDNRRDEGICAYCGKTIWLDTDGWRHDHPGSMPICNHIPEPRV